MSKLSRKHTQTKETNPKKLLSKLEQGKFVDDLIKDREESRRQMAEEFQSSLKNKIYNNAQNNITKETPEQKTIRHQ